MLGDIFLSVIILSLSGSALAALILLTKPLTRKFFGGAWHHYIWLAVLLVMIAPARFDIPLPQKETSVITESDTAEPYTQIVAADTASTGNTTVMPTGTPRGAKAARTVKANRLLGFVWLTGAAAMLLFYILGYIRLLLRIRKNSEVISCPEIEAYTKRNVCVRRGRNMSMPFMTGIFRPTLVLPQRVLSPAQLDNILKHETTHLRRGDIRRRRYGGAARRRVRPGRLRAGKGKAIRAY